MEFLYHHQLDMDRILNNCLFLCKPKNLVADFPLQVYTMPLIKAYTREPFRETVARNQIVVSHAPFFALPALKSVYIKILHHATGD